MTELSLALVVLLFFTLLFGLYWRLKAKIFKKKLKERDEDVDVLMDELERLR